MASVLMFREREEVPMSIVGGLDIHRQQLTFDYVDTVSGQVCRGRVVPADRAGLAAWLGRFEGVGEVVFAVQACTGWRYVAEELVAAGRCVVLAEPADTAAARGPKRRAKTDRADSRLLRELAVDGRVPRCWVPPRSVLETRALLECYQDLRREHTAWVQRVHAALFHQGVHSVGAGGVSSAAGQARVAELAAACLSPAGQVQVRVALDMIEACERQLDALRRRLVAVAGRLRGARELSARIYGVGLITGLALAGSPAPARRCGSPGWTSPCTPQMANAAGGTCPGRARRCCGGACTRRARPPPGAAPPITPTTRRSKTAPAATEPPCPKPVRSSGRPVTS